MSIEEEFLTYHIQNLAKAINLVDALVSEQDSITNYEDGIRKGLGDRLAESITWPSLCATLSDNEERTEIFNGFTSTLMQYSYNCYLLSGHFGPNDDIKEFSMNTIERITNEATHLSIDPFFVFDNAMAIANEKRQEKEKPKKRKKFLGIF